MMSFGRHPEATDAAHGWTTRYSLAPKRIVLAEPDEERSSLLSKAFRDDGLSVIETRDSRWLVEAARVASANGTSLSVSVIVAEFYLRTGTAPAALRLVQRTPEPPRAVLLVPEDDPVARRISEESRPAAVMSWPVDLDDLRMVVLNLAYSPRLRGAPPTAQVPC